MRVEVVYIAYDGERFDSPAKCKEYESRAISLMNEFRSHVLLLDVMKRPILYSKNTTTIESIMEWFHYAYGLCSYVFINVELSQDLITFIDQDQGLIFPPNKVGLYKYDYDDDKWVSAD